jgi:hypothetical protein
MVAGFVALSHYASPSVQPDSAFQSYMDGALASLGIEADEVERAVMAGVWDIYREGIGLLLNADLSGVEPEPTPDLSQPPVR